MKRLLVLSIFLCLAGCDASVGSNARASDVKVALQRQRSDAVYELDLRQEELDNMMKITRKPGVLGVSYAWLRRKNELMEKILQLKIKVHDLDAQLGALN